MVRTTLTLDDEVAAKLRAEARTSGWPDVVNDAIRRGFAVRWAAESADPFRVTARDLGNLRPGLGLDNVAELLDRVEGPLHR